MRQPDTHTAENQPPLAAPFEMAGEQARQVLHRLLDIDPGRRNVQVLDDSAFALDVAVAVRQLLRVGEPRWYRGLAHTLVPTREVDRFVRALTDPVVQPAVLASAEPFGEIPPDHTRLVFDLTAGVDASWLMPSTVLIAPQHVRLTDVRPGRPGEYHLSSETVVPVVTDTLSAEESRRADAGGLAEASAWDRLLHAATPPGYRIFSPDSSDELQHPGLIILEQSGWQVPRAAHAIAPLPGVATVVMAASPDLPPAARADALADVVTRVFGTVVPPLRVLVDGAYGDNMVLRRLVDRLPDRVDVIGPRDQWAVDAGGAVLDPTWSEEGMGFGLFTAGGDPQPVPGYTVVAPEGSGERPAPTETTGQRHDDTTAQRLGGWVASILGPDGAGTLERVTRLHRAFYGGDVGAKSLTGYAEATSASWTQAQLATVVWDVIRHGPGSTAVVARQGLTGQSLVGVSALRNEDGAVYWIDLPAGTVTPAHLADPGTVDVVVYDPSGRAQPLSTPEQMPIWWPLGGADWSLARHTWVLRDPAGPHYAWVPGESGTDLVAYWAGSGLVIAPATNAPPVYQLPVLPDRLRINVTVHAETLTRPLARAIASLLRTFFPDRPPPLRLTVESVDGGSRLAELLSTMLPAGTSIEAPGRYLGWVPYVADGSPQPHLDWPITRRILSYYPGPNVPGEDLYQAPDDEGYPVLQARPRSQVVALTNDQGEHFGLTPFAVRRWVADNDIDLPESRIFEQQLIDVLYPPPESTPLRVYRVEEAAAFVQHVRDRLREHLEDGQALVLEAVREASRWVRDTFPPERYVYVGVGRSPAPIVEALRQMNPQGHSANLPLTAFRPGPAEPDSILAPVLTEPPANPDQLAMLHQHFDEFLGDLPADRPILLVDYISGGGTLISTQHHLQQHLDSIGRRQAVHALGIYDVREDSPGGIEAIRTPLDGDSTDTIAAREQWASRFHLLPLGPDGPLGSLLSDVMASALASGTFKELAEHPPYPLLTQPQRYFERDRPRRDMAAQPAYTILQETIAQHTEHAEVGPETWQRSKAGPSGSSEPLALHEIHGTSGTAREDNPWSNDVQTINQLARDAARTVIQAAAAGTSTQPSDEQQRKILSEFLGIRFIAGIRTDPVDEDSYREVQTWLDEATATDETTATSEWVHTPGDPVALLALLERAGDRGVVVTLPDHGRTASIVYRGDDEQKWRIVLGPEPQPAQFQANSPEFPVQAIAINKCNVALRRSERGRSIENVLPGVPRPDTRQPTPTAPADAAASQKHHRQAAQHRDQLN